IFSAGVEEKNLKCVVELTNFWAEALKEVSDIAIDARVVKIVFFMISNFNYLLLGFIYLALSI
ncbi:MAG: hypothetical protein CVT95_13610, partial [Bacteroidetes bacterium HGW-Bacteroidetes-12]